MQNFLNGLTTYLDKSMPFNREQKSDWLLTPVQYIRLNQAQQESDFLGAGYCDYLDTTNCLVLLYGNSKEDYHSHHVKVVSPDGFENVYSFEHSRVFFYGYMAAITLIN